MLFTRQEPEMHFIPCELVAMRDPLRVGRVKEVRSHAADTGGRSAVTQAAA